MVRYLHAMLTASTKRQTDADSNDFKRAPHKRIQLTPGISSGRLPCF